MPKKSAGSGRSQTAAAELADTDTGSRAGVHANVYNQLQILSQADDAIFLRIVLLSGAEAAGRLSRCSLEIRQRVANADECFREWSVTRWGKRILDDADEMQPEAAGTTAGRESEPEKAADGLKQGSGAVARKKSKTAASSASSNQDTSQPGLSLSSSSSAAEPSPSTSSTCVGPWHAYYRCRCATWSCPPSPIGLFQEVRACACACRHACLHTCVCVLQQPFHPVLHA